MEFKEIREYEKLVNEKLRNAEKSDRDSDWVEWNSMWAELGRKIQKYGGYKLYKRQKKLTILISEIDNNDS